MTEFLGTTLGRIREEARRDIEEGRRRLASPDRIAVSTDHATERSYRAVVAYLRELHGEHG